MKAKEDRERYTDHALRIRMMNEQGIAVYAYDQLGHGFSEGTRFYIPNGNYKINRDDLVKFVQLAANENAEGIPLFISGDSYGGCTTVLATYYLQENPDKAPKGLVGCTLNCPSIHADLPPKPVIWFLQYGLAPFWPEWTPSFMPHPITSERIWKLEEPRKYFSDHKEMHDLSRGGVPFCLGTALGCMLSLQDAQKCVPNFKMPFHISHGTSDYGVPISGSQFMFDSSQTPDADKQFNPVEDGYHALYSQLDAEQTMKHEIDWILSMIKKQELQVVEEENKLPN